MPAGADALATAAPRLRRSVACAGWLVDAAAVLVAWAALLLAENVVLGFIGREQFSAAWEVSFARDTVIPIALVALAPAALAVVAPWRLVCAAGRGSRRARWSCAALAASGAAATAIGVSTGRHFQAPSLRAAFVAGVAAASGALAWWAAPRIGRATRSPAVIAAGGVAVAVGAWIADEYVLPRLYPAFHAALLVAVLLGVAAAGLAWTERAGERSRRARVLALAVGAAVLACAAWSPHAVHALERASNVRIVLVERAPLLGRAVELAAAVSPPAADDSSAASAASAASASAASTGPTEVARALDWSGRDVVLVSVDALRADHVSAYGYPRPTTPNIDALAREGALFEHVYCPTPHTSYSVTSMMTGKYLRPLLALGLGDDSETWAEDLRRYGWRTAAFYPPAVFFIDEARFPRFEASHLGFEYAKVEFADPALRERQVAEYLDGAPAGTPLFLWVHFFEPHEPYLPHADHVFAGAGSGDVDLYDGEVATADDGIGRVVRLMRARRPGAVVIVTADHGEEFGEHGGRYHGTTVYEEQVRVPLVVVGPGVRAGTRVGAVAQTIDLLPTALSALGLPRPARVRGRDLGPLLVGRAPPADPGFAFAETDDYALVAAGRDRLVCERRVAACALYEPDDDPLERRDLAAQSPARFDELRAKLRTVERDHGRYESAGAAWPEALRRGLQGDAEAAVDVAALLDDANLPIRRKAAEVSYELHAAAVAPQLRRALATDEDEEVRRWAALALARMGEPAPPLVEALLGDASRDWRPRAALALGERGDARACDELAAWWTGVVPAPAPAAGDGGAEGDGEPPRLTADLAQTEAMLLATSKPRCRSAVSALLRALDDVRARPYVADALGAIGDDRARGPLLALLAAEPYVSTRPHEARALLALGVHDWTAPAPEPEVHATLGPLRSAAAPARLLVLLSDAAARLDVLVDGAEARAMATEGEVRSFELLAPQARRPRVDLKASSGGVVALWTAQD
jgi:HEAT repeat protein